MDVIRNWAFGLIIVSVIGTIVTILAPSGSAEKQVKIAVSIVMITACVSPFLSGFKYENPFDSEYDTYTVKADDYGEHIASVFKKDLNMKILAFLQKNGIKAENTEIYLSYEDNEVAIQQVVVFVSEEHRNNSDKIRNLIKREYGIIAEVEVVS